MNTKQLTTMNKLNRLEDMTNTNIELIAESLKENNGTLTSDLLNTLTELTSIFYATINLTEITETMINDELLKKYHLTYNQLVSIELKMCRS